MKHLLFVVSFIVFAGVAALTHFVFNKKAKIIEKVLVGILIVLFAVRFMCYKDIQVEEGFAALTNHGIDRKAFVPIMGELSIWFSIVANLFIFLGFFFEDKSSNWFVKFISTPLIIIAVIFMNSMLFNMIGEVNNTLESMRLVEILLPLELGASLALCAYIWLRDFKVRAEKVDYPFLATFGTLAPLFAIPPYLPMFLFGLGNMSHHPLDLNIYHRLILYVLIISLPLLIYFLLRNSSEQRKRYSLIFISLGVMLNFVFYNKYDVFIEPWRLPFHLCNTAVFILPICYIFKTKKLFYFTYFINVFGALLAMLMPNYSEFATILEPGVVRFWYNHMLAFWGPLLGVALKVFDRPKLKQYFYSSCWFLVYFALAMFLNSLFTALGHETDYFFINTDYVADKLGTWAENLFEGHVQFNIGDLTIVLRPLYQSLYFLVYVLLGFGVWFVYQLFFDISDSHYLLHIKLKGIRQDKIALESVLNGRSIEEPMVKDAGIKLEIDHFSKKYGINKHYSVHDANFVVEAGEVFGFLGPNGAGKSTTIKSIVGIQPITEGNIRVCGYDVKTQSVMAKSNIGFVPDHYALYEKLTGREYINYIADIFKVSKEDREERIKKYVELFELEGSIDNKIKTYSHGMKQKITIISALIHNPKVWILDEPLTGLDPTSIFQVKQCIKKHAEEGNIVFFSSHLIDIVEKLCDRVAIIKHGEIQAVDTVKNIEKKHGSLEKFYLETIGDNVTQVGK